MDQNESVPTALSELCRQRVDNVKVLSSAAPSQESIEHSR